MQHTVPVAARRYRTPQNTQPPQQPYSQPARPQQLPKARSSIGYLPMLIIGSSAGLIFGVIVLLCIVILFAGLHAANTVQAGLIVRAAGMPDVPVGGLSAEDAAAALKTIAVNQMITLRDGSRTWQVSSADLGISLDPEATAQRAYAVGRSIPANVQQVTPVYKVDLAKTANTLSALGKAANVAPYADSSMSAGRNLNVNATIDKFPADLNVLLTAKSLDLVMDTVQGPRTNYTVQRGEELNLIAKKFNIPAQSIVALNNIQNPNQIYPGQVLIIPAAGVWTPTEKDAPPAPLAQGRSIVVKVSEQRIYAYQDGHLVHSSLMSSGREGHDTVRGDFHIYVKYESTRMTGPDYDLPNVPWTMYFYQGYGIHGAYWHNSFGREMSHGCVNLETSEAKWFYDFAPIGTLVRIID